MGRGEGGVTMAVRACFVLLLCSQSYTNFIFNRSREAINGNQTTHLFSQMFKVKGLLERNGRI